MTRATYRIYPGLYTPGAADLQEGSLTSGTRSKAVFTDFLSGDRITLLHIGPGQIDETDFLSPLS